MEDLELEEGGGSDSNDVNEQDIEQGGILLLSDSDSEHEEEEKEEDPDEDPTEKRRRKRQEEKQRHERKQLKSREAPPPVIRRFQNPLVHRISFGVGDYAEIRLDRNLMANCHGAAIFDGYPSKGLSSAMISKFLIKGLQLPMIGYIKSNLLPVVCRISDSQPSHALRIYGNNRVVVFTSEVPIPPEASPQISQLVYYCQTQIESEYIFCTESLPQKIEELDVDIPDDPSSLTQSGLMRFVEQIADANTSTGNNKKEKEQPAKGEKGKQGKEKQKAFSANKAKEFFGSELVESSHSQPIAEVMYITNDQGVSDQLRKSGYLPVRNAVVGNVTGSILAESACVDCKVVCLVARHNPVLSDARASIILVRIISELVGSSWHIDFHLLEKKVDHIERQIKKSIRDIGVSGRKNAPSSYQMYT